MHSAHGSTIAFLGLILGIAAYLTMYFMRRIPLLAAGRANDIRIPEPSHGKEYTLWLARQQGFDLSHRTGAGVSRFFVLKPRHDTGHPNWVALSDMHLSPQVTRYLRRKNYGQFEKKSEGLRIPLLALSLLSLAYAGYSNRLGCN